MTIGLMEEQGVDEEEWLDLIVRYITPTSEELERLIRQAPDPTIVLDDDEF